MNVMEAERARMWYRLLNQDELWGDQFGELFRIEEMTSSHRTASMLWLKSLAPTIEYLYTYVDFDTQTPEELIWRNQNPVSWLEQTPLFLKLKKLDEAQFAGRVDLL